MKFYDSASGRESTINFKEWLYRRIDLLSRWHSLRAIGSSKVSVLSILTPVAGYLIIFNTKFEIFESGWKVSSFYLGTVLFSLGTLIYAYSCPGECKKYDTAIEYTGAEAEFFSANHAIMIKMINRALVKRRWPTYFSPSEDHIRSVISEIERAKGPVQRKPFMMTLMDEYWHMLNPSNPWCRYTCLSLYAAGTLLISLPGLVTTLEIVTELKTRGPC